MPGQAPRVVVVGSAPAAHHPRHHYRLAAALAAAGFDVTTMTPPDLAPAGHVDAVPVRYLPSREGRLARMTSAPLSILRAARMRPDVVCAVSLDLLPWVVLLRLTGRCRVVYDSNEEYDTMMLIKSWLPRRSRPILQRIVRWLEPWLARRLDAATVALPATYEKFRAAGVRCVLVRNFPPSTIADGFQRGPEFAYDVLLGGSLPDDQVPLLAETAARLEELADRPLRWLVAARSYYGQDDRDMLESALTQAGVRDSFDLRYNVPFAEMRVLLEASRIAFLLYPGDANYAARIPIRIFEYMACGMPFVGSDLPTTAQFTAGLGVAELVEARPEAFAAALWELLCDPARQEEMSRRGPQVARERYNWELEAEKLVALYRELTGSEPKVRSSASSSPNGGRQPSTVSARDGG
jgi:glycosyltransferase involved in cell wall biosynthesis